jgi:hypothetical protein
VMKWRRLPPQTVLTNLLQLILPKDTFTLSKTNQCFQNLPHKQPFPNHPPLSVVTPRLSPVPLRKPSQSTLARVPLRNPLQNTRIRTSHLLQPQALPALPPHHAGTNSYRLLENKKKTVNNAFKSTLQSIINYDGALN